MSNIDEIIENGTKIVIFIIIVILGMIVIKCLTSLQL
jgi:hypothetical protein